MPEVVIGDTAHERRDETVAVHSEAQRERHGRGGDDDDAFRLFGHEAVALGHVGGQGQARADR